MLDAFKRASASRVTAVIPYYGYARQDKKDAPRVPISGQAGRRPHLAAPAPTASSPWTCTPRRSRASSTCRWTTCSPRRCCSTPSASIDLPDLVIVSPDAGGVERARAIAKRLDAGLAIVDKRRVAKNEAEVMHLIGEVEGMTALVVDDIIDTAGTLTKTADLLRRRGAVRILAAGIHGVLSGPALDRINASPDREGADHRHHPAG